MSIFTSPLVVSPLPDGRNWMLMLPFTYHVGSEYSNKTIKVPKGFITDFASTPPAIYWLIPPWGRYGKAAVLHDYLYQSHKCSRKQADDIFLEAMEVLGVEKWRRFLMYRAVRMFGCLAWHSRRKYKC